MSNFIKKYPKSTLICTAVVICVLGAPIALGLGDYAKTGFWYFFWPILAGVLVVAFIAIRSLIKGNNE